jgi:predicted flap endonuclease-1-like 5' DNA nuclease
VTTATVSASTDGHGRARAAGSTGGTTPVPGGRGGGHAGDPAVSLHISKLRGVGPEVRARLKVGGITYSDQLLHAAATPERRGELQRATGLDPAVIARLARRADLSRIKGIVAVFADMLERVGVDHVEALRHASPGELHARLHELNRAERMARRSPTPEEVEDWVGQARALPPVLVDPAV